MRSTTRLGWPAAHRALALLLLALGMLALLGPVQASAAEDDPYKIAGNVQFEGEAIEGVTITVDGPGGAQVVETGPDGRWNVGVPEAAEYTVTLDVDTLPEGVTLDDPEDDSPETKEVTPNVPFAPKAVNFFIGEGDRESTAFGAQLAQRLVQGINFGLMLGLAAVGLSWPSLAGPAPAASPMIFRRGRRSPRGRRGTASSISPPAPTDPCC